MKCWYLLHMTIRNASVGLKVIFFGGGWGGGLFLFTNEKKKFMLKSTRISLSSLQIVYHRKLVCHDHSCMFCR